MRFQSQLASICLISGSLSLMMIYGGCTGPKQNRSSPNQDKVSKLFEKTDSSETGFYFLNELEETEDINIFTYLNLYNGGGVATGDINNDGLPDIFMGGNFFGGRLFLNEGNFSFRQISETANVFHPGFTTGVTMADVNHDGYLDIYLCRSLQQSPSGRTNLLLINNHDLTFTERGAEFGLDDSGYSTHATFFDMDNDGDLDVYVLNHRTDFEFANHISPEEMRKEAIESMTEEEYQAYSSHLYRNDGQGSFQDVTREAGLAGSFFGLSVTASDINQDGWTDLFVACDHSDKDQLYLNNGDGTFTDQVDQMMRHISRSSMGSDIADINNDGFPDIMVLDMKAEDNYRQKQLGFGLPSYDMFSLAHEYGLHYQVSRNCLQVNNGNGTFSEVAQLAGVSASDWSWAPLLADFDNDGYKDIFITNGYPKDITDQDFVKYMADSISNSYSLGKSLAFHLSSSVKSTPLRNYLFRNSGGLSFTNKAAEWGLTDQTFSNGAAYADFDRDGDLDLVINNFNQPALLYRNNLSEAHPAQHFLSVRIEGGKRNPQGIGAKAWITSANSTQYQELQPVRGFLSSCEPILHFGLGTSQTISRLEVIFPDGSSVTRSNIPCDQMVTIKKSEASPAVRQQMDPPTMIFSNLEDLSPYSFLHPNRPVIDFKKEPLLEQMGSNRGPFVAVSDVNGDALDDFYIGGSAGFAGELFIQTPGKEFLTVLQPDFQSDKKYQDGQSLFFDADGDGDQDLLVTNYRTLHDSELSQNRLYLNDGSGHFHKTSGRIPTMSSNSICAETIDFDLDGDLDIVIGGHITPGKFPLADASYLLVNEGGIFRKTDLPLQGIVNDVAALDINQDGLPDLLVCGEWMNITVLLNEGQSFRDATEQYGLQHSSGMWYSLRVLDVDGDGDLDFIAGNRGTNTFFRPTLEKPAMVTAADLDHNGQLDPIFSQVFSDGVRHPTHSLNILRKQIPGVQRMFPSYHEYSKANLESLFNGVPESAIHRRSIFTYESSVFLNLGAQGFIRKALPPEAQFSHIMDILPIRQHGMDGILIVGNNHSVNVGMGRDDASNGLWLAWDGQEYQSVPGRESGFFAPGETRQVTALTSSNDDLIILVTQRNGPLQLFNINESNF